MTISSQYLSYDIHDGDEKDDDDNGEYNDDDKDDKDDDDDQNGESNAILVKIIHDMSQVLLDDVLLGDSEAIRNAKKKIEHFVRQNYPFICSIFEHFTFNSLCTDREGTILINGCGAIRYIDLVHFVVQNQLMKPTEETLETIEQIMKNMGSSRLSEIAREEGDSGGKRSDEGKKSDVEGPGINYFLVTQTGEDQAIFPSR